MKILIFSPDLTIPYAALSLARQSRTKEEYALIQGLVVTSTTSASRTTGCRYCLTVIEDKKCSLELRQPQDLSAEPLLTMLSSEAFQIKNSACRKTSSGRRHSAIQIKLWTTQDWPVVARSSSTIRASKLLNGVSSWRSVTTT